MKQIGAELGVRYVSRQRAEKKRRPLSYHSTAQHVSDRQPVWAEHYDRNLTDVFACRRDHRGDRAAIEAADLCGRKFFAAGAKPPNILDAGIWDEGAVALLADNARGQCGRTGAAFEKATARSDPHYAKAAVVLDHLS